MRNISKPTASAPPALFTEREAWRPAGQGWQPLHGNFRGVGYSFEWHDFTPATDFDWGATFHPDSLELCLNLSGQAFVESEGNRTEFGPNTVGFYVRSQGKLEARRIGGHRHRFLTVEYSQGFLAQHLGPTSASLHPLARSILSDQPVKRSAGSVTSLTQAARQTVESLKHPPVHASAQPLWYQCKAIELAVCFLFQPESGAELFCTRQQRVAQERVEQVLTILKQNLCEPPSLEELGRRIGCSHFYLSRIFSAQTGQTLPQYLRQLRMEKAAELLASGEYNVTEAAMEVGYSSLSHFSQAFHETFGCCPGLYPINVKTMPLSGASVPSRSAVGQQKKP